MRIAAIALVLCSLAPVAGSARQAPSAPGEDPLHRPLDEILDLYVRDGLVYYRALKTERARLDRYTASLNVPARTYDGWSPQEKMAFWVDAYNAFVLETVINHYPIHGRSSAYPASSIRQIPGAFEEGTWRAAGRSVTLDQIEKNILPEFKEPRLYLALGRGAIGSGRLRSEAYTASRLAGQLDAIQKEFVSEQQMLRIDRAGGQISVTPIVSWREQAFVAAYDKPDSLFAQRSPIERALLAFIQPNLLPLEKEFVQKNEFKVVFHQFDWTLNDLTGR
jgi:Protein of unknown function, DUF547